MLDSSCSIGTRLPWSSPQTLCFNWFMLQHRLLAGELLCTMASAEVHLLDKRSNWLCNVRCFEASEAKALRNILTLWKKNPRNNSIALHEGIRYHGFSKVPDEKPDENIRALVRKNTDLRCLLNQLINNKKSCNI